MTEPEQDTGPVCAATSCTRPPAAGIRLCAKHTEVLGQAVANIGTQYELLSAVPSMQGREVGTIGGSTLAAQRDPARLDVLVLRDPRSKERSEYDFDGNNGLGVLEVLHAYAEQVREERDLAQPVTYVEACLFPCMHRACLLGMGHPVRVPLTVERERRLLAVHLDWIIRQDWAGDFRDAIVQLWGLLKSANGHGAPRPGYVAVCGCGGRIRWANGAATCGSCGTTIRAEAAGEDAVA